MMANMLWGMQNNQQGLMNPTALNQRYQQNTMASSPNQNGYKKPGGAPGTIEQNQDWARGHYLTHQPSSVRMSNGSTGGSNPAEYQAWQAAQSGAQNVMLQGKNPFKGFGTVDNDGNATNIFGGSGGAGGVGGTGGAGGSGGTGGTSGTGSGGTGGKGGVGGLGSYTTSIDTGGIWSDPQIQQQVNQQRASLDQAGATDQAAIQSKLASSGFGSNSPLAAALANQRQAATAAAGTGMEQNTRWNAAQGNANQLLQSQTARAGEGTTLASILAGLEQSRMASQASQQNALFQALMGMV